MAGTIINSDILDSLEYASKVARTKVVVAFSHTQYGAVMGASDDAKLGKLTQLVNKIRPAVNARANVHGFDRSLKNHYVVDAVAHKNVHQTLKGDEMKLTLTPKEATSLNII